MTAGAVAARTHLTNSHGQIEDRTMRTILVSEFKAKCIATLKDVRRTRRPLLVTLRGTPLATIHPPEYRRRAKRLGGLKGHMVIRRSLVRADTSADWEMLR